MADDTPDESGSPAAEKGADYVGYKHPPKRSQFKKGQSGNPGGKRGGAKNNATLVHEILNEKVSVNEGGKRRRMSRFEFSLRRVVEKAMKGDAKAFQLLTSMMEAGEAPDATGGYQLTEDDKHIIDSMAKRGGRQGGKS